MFPGSIQFSASKPVVFGNGAASFDLDAVKLAGQYSGRNVLQTLGKAEKPFDQIARDFGIDPDQFGKNRTELIDLLVDLKNAHLVSAELKTIKNEKSHIVSKRFYQLTEAGKAAL